MLKYKANLHTPIKAYPDWSPLRGAGARAEEIKTMKEELEKMVATMKELLEAGVHFGHQVKRWNPKMKRYIFGERNGIYIIDLQKTLKGLEAAYNFIREVAATNQPILFVGTKKQAQDSIAEEAKKAGAYYVNQRWLGGMLTNFKTIKKSIERLRKIDVMREDGTYNRLTKKEISRIEKERGKLEKYLSGMKDMPALPGAIFIVDPRKERIVVAEVQKLSIPCVAIVDTNCDPDEIDYVIPGNDDAIRAITLISSKMAEAVIAGRDIYNKKTAEKAEESKIEEKIAATEPGEAAQTPVEPAAPASEGAAQ